jgi:hypothetical protein
MVKAEAVEEGDSSGQCGSAETERKEDALKGDDPLGMVADRNAD